MDDNIRNEIMLDHEYLIKAAIRRNIALLKALRIEADDAYQDLSFAMLKALKSYDPARSSIPLTAYIRTKLQYAILDMKKRYKPCGITGAGGTKITFVSVNYTYRNSYAADSSFEDDQSVTDLSDILASLAPSEREALDLGIDGRHLRKKNQRACFASACDKVLAMI